MAAEMPTRTIDPRDTIRASMGPQLIGCGDPPAGNLPVHSRMGFNGAAADWLRRSPVKIDALKALARASMGPQLIGCGDNSRTGRAESSR